MILVNKNIQSINEVDEDYNDKFLPYNLQQYPLYTKSNTLINIANDSWTDQELLAYFNDQQTYESYFVSSDDSKEILYTKDFYESYPSTIDEIWYETAVLNNIEINKEGVDFWKFMFEPYLGTYLIQEKLLEKADVVNGEVIEWFDTEVMVDGELTEIAKNLTGMYSLKMDTYPGDEKAIFLIQASLKIKNVESKLASVTDSQCPSALRLNIGKMNFQRLNGNFVNFYFDIGLCFTTRNEFILETFNDFYGNGVVGYSSGYLNDDVLIQGLHPHTYNAGIALGELDGVSYENVPSRDIFQAKYDLPSVVEYEAFITGVKPDFTINRKNRTNIFAETIPGVNLAQNFWDDRLWDATIWETGSYIETIRDIVGDPAFSFTPGVGLTYVGFGYKVQFISTQTFMGYINETDWTFDRTYFRYLAGTPEADGRSNGSVEKYATGAEATFETSIATVIGTQYKLKFTAVVNSGTPSVLLDGVYMPTTDVIAINNVNIGSHVEFTTGDVELVFTATGAHTIGVIDNTGTFSVDAFSVEEYTPVTVLTSANPSGIVVDVLAPSIYKTESIIQNTDPLESATAIYYIFD